MSLDQGLNDNNNDNISQLSIFPPQNSEAKQAVQISKEYISPQNQPNPKTPGTRHRSPHWSLEEDKRLLEAVQQHGSSNWEAVATFVGNGRSKAQCSQRFHRVIDPKISKANWTQEEEEKLLKAVEQFGDKAWTRVAAQFGNRTDVQCRFKYKHLQKKLATYDAPLQVYTA